jgi:hypothetical protein
MRIKKLKHIIEMWFWAFAIPILETEALTVKKFVNAGYYSYQRYHPMNFFFKSFFWGCMGLTFGLVIGLIFG